MAWKLGGQDGVRFVFCLFLLRFGGWSQDAKGSKDGKGNGKGKEGKDGNSKGKEGKEGKAKEAKDSKDRGWRLRSTFGHLKRLGSTARMQVGRTGTTGRTGGRIGIRRRNGTGIRTRPVCGQVCPRYVRIALRPTERMELGGRGSGKTRARMARCLILVRVRVVQMLLSTRSPIEDFL